MRTMLLLPLMAGLLAGCDPALRCQKAIDSTQAEVNAAREKETDIDRINAVVQAGQILSTAEIRKNEGAYDACMMEVERAKAELARALVPNG